jgi:hypothetical protein
MPESSVVDFLTDPDGLFQFTISYPSPENFPDVAGKSAMLLGYLFQVTDLRATDDGENTLLTIRKTKSRGASGTWDELPNVAGQTVLPTYALLKLPEHDGDDGDGVSPPTGGGSGTGGGDIPVVPVYPPSGPEDAPTPGGRETIPIVPVGGPFLVIGAVVAALAGLGIVYLIVDKVERIVESPAVSSVLYVGALAVLVALYAGWKKGFFK